MNTRIQELVVQAKIMAEEVINGKIPKNHTLDAFAEKFAELIVQDCIDICEQQRIKIIKTPSDPSWTEHLAECQISMEQTFLRSMP